MKNLLVIVISVLALSINHTPAFAAGEMKEVCKDKKDKDGKVVKNKEGKPEKVCKKIKVHKKLEGTPVPEKK